MLTLDKVYQAAYVLKDVARKTDLILAQKLSPDNPLYLKTENLQLTGSFKLRGAWFSYEDQRIGQGRENVKIYLKEHPELMQEIDAKVRAAVKDKNNIK